MHAGMHTLHCLEHLSYAHSDSDFHLGCVFFNVFLISRFFCLQNLARDDYCIGGLSLAGPNRYCKLQPYNSPAAHHNHHPHFHPHPHPQHPHHHHPQHPHHRRRQLIPVTIAFVIINFLHRSGQQPH